MKSTKFLLAISGILFIAASSVAQEAGVPPTKAKGQSDNQPGRAETGFELPDGRVETGFELPDGRKSNGGDGPHPLKGYDARGGEGPHPLIVDIRQESEGKTPVVEISVSQGGGEGGPKPLAVIRVHGAAAKAKPPKHKAAAPSVNEYRGTGRVYRKLLFGKTAIGLEFAPGIAHYVDYNHASPVPMPIQNLDGKVVVIRGTVETRLIPGEGPHDVIVAESIIGLSTTP